MTATKKKPARFRITPTMSDRAVGVDVLQETIFGVTIMELGPTSDLDSRTLYVDRTTQEQYVELANADKDGKKASFTHGDATDENLGNYLGRWFNARIDGSKVRQDLNLSPRSHDSPRGDLGKYVLGMAETDPDMLGASMVVSFDMAAMRKAKRADGSMPIRLKAVWGADIVDSPALVKDGLFSAAPSPPNEKELAMSEATPAAPAGITQEQLDATLAATLEKFGQTLSESILGQVAEKFSAKPAEPADDTPTPEELEKRGAVRARQIFSAAAMSGLPDHDKLAEEAIEKGFSLETFKASITDRLIASNGLTKDEGKGADDKYAKFRNEYREGIDQFQAAGITEERYIRTRCKDEDMPLPLKPNAA